MSVSVGRVNLDVGLNQKSLQKEIKGMGGSFKSSFSKLGGSISVAIGNMIASAVQAAAKNIGKFISSSIELGSSIAELENVTSTVFPTMSGQLESFSKSALQQYGLTEMQTKKMMGTFGAMAQSFNYTEAQSYAMSESLTGLVGDVASFYNLEHDVAYTKIKSVFTGETESLKELGIVMTQTALDEFAMRQGMGKTVQQMNEQEKVALRLAFVTEKLNFAAGDFNKTQDQWANQTRILSGQWDSFKAALGQGFIAILTPVIQGLNSVMAVVVKLGEKFRDFISIITGQESSSSGSGALISEVSEVTTAAADTAEIASDKATSAAKEVKKSLMGFDKLNKLDAPSSTSSGSGEGGGSSISSLPSSPVSSTEQSSNSAIGSLDKLKQKLEEIASWTGYDRLWAGIQSGVNKINFSAIKTNFSSIMSSLQPIASSTFEGIGTVSRSFLDYLGTHFGQMTALLGRGVEIATGGVSRFLAAESENISSWIGSISKKLAKGFDNLKFSSKKIFGSLWTALDQNQTKIETFISKTLTTLTNMGMTVGTIFVDMWEGLTEGFANWTAEHEEELTNFFSGIIETVTLMSDTVTGIVGGLFSSLSDFWENTGKRIWQEIVEVFLDIIEWVMLIWDTILKPVIDHLISRLKKLWDESLKPLWDNILALIGSIWDLIKPLWDNLLKPLVDWFIKTFGPIISGILNSIGDVFFNVFGTIFDIISGVITALRGLIDFIAGVFTGDWEKAWSGLKTFFKGIWDAIWAIVKAPINLIIWGLNKLWSAIYSVVSGIVNGIGGIAGFIGDLLGQDWDFSMPSKPPLIPYLAEGGYVKANQPQLAVIGDNKRHGEIVAPEDKLYEIVSKALQAFMGQLVMALNSGKGTAKDSETLQLIVQLGEETLVNRIIKLINAESRRQGTTVIRV